MLRKICVPVYAMMLIWGVGAPGCDSGDDPASEACGNGVVDEGEACDGADLGAATCASEFPIHDPMGYPPDAMPACTATCELDPEPCRMHCMACLYSALEVTVVAADGTGLPPADLWLESDVEGSYECFCWGDYGTDCAEANACDGMYEFGSGLGAGTIEITARAPGYQDATALVEFDADVCGTPPKEHLEIEMVPVAEPPPLPPLRTSLMSGCM